MSTLTSVTNGTAQTRAAHSIVLSDLTKTFVRRSGEEVRAIDDISLQVGSGEFLVLLGPSGCGKTTLLRCLAGLETPSSGSIVVEDRPAYDSDAGLNVPPESRRMGMIFQSYALWPHMTVQKNVGYPLKVRGDRRSDVDQAVHRTLSMVGIPELADQYPGQISGGQQQRVALARALVGGNSVVLFDEPLSNVDAKVREQLRLEIKQMHHELGFTAIYVTHDQEEAMALATRIAVLSKGEVAQLGTPADIYERPASLVVGRFIGRLNELEGTVRRVEGRHCTIETAIGDVAVQDCATAAVGDTVTVGIRPEHLRLDRGDGSSPETNAWPGTVEVPVYLGAHNDYVVDVDGVDMQVSSRGPLLSRGDQVVLHVRPHEVHVFPSGAASSAGVA